MIDKFANEHIATIGMIVAIFFVDQLTKLLAATLLEPLTPVPVVGDFLRFTYVENPGLAFGVEVENKILLHFISVAAVCLIFYYLFRLRDNPGLRIAFAAILGGAFGNLADRFLRGKVVDFLDMEFFNIYFSGGTYLSLELPAFSMTRWPVFNIADLAVTAGMLIVLMTTFFDNPDRYPRQNANRQTSQISGE